MLAEVLEGMVMVRGLAELEPPKNLVHNILAATSRKEATAEQIAEEAKLGWMERLRREHAAAGRRATAFTLCHVIRHGVLFTQHHA